MSTPPPPPPPPPAGPPPPPYNAVPFGQPGPQQNDGLATASLVTGISAIALCCLGVLLGPVAIVLGALSLRRGVKSAKAYWGISLGATGLVLSGLVIVGWIMMANNDFRDGDASDGAIPPAWQEEATDALVEDLRDMLAEEQPATGPYAGGIQETPCFDFEGRSGWLANNPQEVLDACYMDYELWYSYDLDAEGNIIVTDVGAGAIYGKVGFEPVSDEFVEQNFPDRDNESMRAYLVDEFLTTEDITVTSVDDAELGGLPATRFETDSPRSDTRVVYAVFTPTDYDAGPSDSSSFFIISIQNTHDELEIGAGIEQQVLDTFSWR